MVYCRLAKNRQQHLDQRVADEAVCKPGEHANRDADGHDVLLCVQLFVTVHHCCVRGGRRGEHGNEDHEDDAHEHRGGVDAQLLAEPDDDWKQDDCHGCVVREVGDDKRDKKHDADERPFGLAAQKRVEHLDEPLGNADGGLGEHACGVNCRGDHEEDAPVEMLVSDFLEVQDRLAVNMDDQASAHEGCGHAKDADVVEDVANRVALNEVRNKGANQINRDHPDIDLLNKVHLGQGHLLFNHLRGDGLHLGHVDAKNELHYQQVSSQDEGGHQDVGYDVGQVRNGRSYGLGECAQGNQRGALEGQQGLEQGDGKEHAHEEELPDAIFFGDAHDLHVARGDRPHKDQRDENVQQARDDCAGKKEKRYVRIGATSKDLTGQNVLRDVLRVANLIDGAEQDHREQDQQYRVATDGLQPNIVGAGIAQADCAHKDQTDDRGPQRFNRGPCVDHHQEHAKQLHSQWSDGLRVGQHSHKCQQAEADRDMYVVQVFFLFCHLLLPSVRSTEPPQSDRGDHIRFKENSYLTA